MGNKCVCVCVFVCVCVHVYTRADALQHQLTEREKELAAQHDKMRELQEKASANQNTASAGEEMKLAVARLEDENTQALQQQAAKLQQLQQRLLEEQARAQQAEQVIYATLAL
jgi:septal ring factor EnvC (AmiA/AmiB activator)